MQLLTKSVRPYSPRTYPSRVISNYTLALVEIIQASSFLSLTVNYLPKVNNQICKDRIADSVSMQGKSPEIVYHLTVHRFLLTRAIIEWTHWTILIIFIVTCRLFLVLSPGDNQSEIAISLFLSWIIYKLRNNAFLFQNLLKLSHILKILKFSMMADSRKM